jgi:hypothetical protein
MGWTNGVRFTAGIFLYSTAFRPALGPTKSPVQRERGSLSPEVKRPGRKAYHSPPSNAEVKNCGAIPPLHASSWLGDYLIKHRDNFIFLRGIGGRATAQAVSHRTPNAAARVRARVRSWGIYDGQSGPGAGFLRVLRFPLPILIPPTARQSSSSIIRGWYNRPISGRSTKWTQSPHPKKLKKTRGIGCETVDWFKMARVTIPQRTL